MIATSSRRRATADPHRGDKEIDLAAVAQNGLTLRLVERTAKCDRDVVLAAVAQNSAAYELADANLCADKEITLSTRCRTVAQNGLTFRLI